MTRKLRRVQFGFTIVDMLIAICCLALIVLAVLGMMTLSEKVSRQAEARTAATSIARQQFELLRSRSLASRLTGAQIPFSVPSSVMSQYPAATNVRMSGVYTVEDVAGSDTLQRITVWVSWGTLSRANDSSPSSTVVLSGLVSNDPYTVNVTGQGTVSELFVPPPPPPPPIDPAVTGTTGTTDPTSGTTGTTDPTTGSTGNPVPDNTTGTVDPTSGSTTGTSTSGGSSGGTTGGGSTTPPPDPVAEFDLYGGMWGLFYPVSLLP